MSIQPTYLPTSQKKEIHDEIPDFQALAVVTGWRFDPSCLIQNLLYAVDHDFRIPIEVALSISRLKFTKTNLRNFPSPLSFLHHPSLFPNYSAQVVDPYHTHIPLRSYKPNRPCDFSD